MNELNREIKEILFLTLSGEHPVKEFEEWVYKNDELEKYISNEIYLELISFNYNQNGAIFSLGRILLQLLDVGEFETWKIKRILKQIINKTGDYAKAIHDIYYMPSQGLTFLAEFSFHFSLCLDYPWQYKLESFNSMTEEQKKITADSLYPSVAKEAEIILNWIETKQIIISGNYYDNTEQRTFIDNRLKT